MNVLSVDAATQAGWAVVSSNGARVRVLTYGTARSETEVIRDLVAHLLPIGIDRAIIEEPYVGQNPATAIVLGRIVGWWEHELGRAGVPVSLVKADTWQKSMLLGLIVPRAKRAQRKRAAQLWVRSVYGIEANEDEADAISMGTWAVRQRAFAERTRRVPKPSARKVKVARARHPKPVGTASHP